MTIRFPRPVFDAKTGSGGGLGKLPEWDLTDLYAAPDAPEAQFIMAEALSGQHQWSRAAIAYDDSYNRAKRGPHAAASLLGLAASLSAINESRAACETLGELRHQFPRDAHAMAGQISAVSRRARCR